jgi:hypothetical protein
MDFTFAAASSARRPRTATFSASSVAFPRRSRRRLSLWAFASAERRKTILRDLARWSVSSR